MKKIKLVEVDKVKKKNTDKMGIESVRDEILNLASKDANLKISLAEEKAKEIETETALEIEASEKQLDSEINSILEQLSFMNKAKVSFELKKIELMNKKEILNKVFEDAFKKIENLDSNTQKRLIDILIKNAEDEIDIAYIICNEETTKWIPKKYEIKNDSMLGGIIAETKDGKLRVDYRYETILEEVRRIMIKRIAEKIF